MDWTQKKGGYKSLGDTSHLDFTSSFMESVHSEDASISDQPCERFPESDNTCAPVPLCNRCIRTMGSPMNHQTEIPMVPMEEELEVCEHKISVSQGFL